MLGLVLGLVVLTACSGVGGDVRSEPTTTRKPRAAEPPSPTADPCADFPPPFEATYLPEGFDPRLRRGAGLFKGPGAEGYPTEGLLGHYRGEVEVVHANFEVRGGPLPYEPAEPRPLVVLGRRASIGKIEGGYAVEFSLGDCDFRMDTYGVGRRQTVKLAKGLREIDAD